MEQHSGSPILMKILSENQFSGKTYLYTIASRMYPCDRKIGVGISQKYLLEELKESAKMEDGDVKMAGIEEGDENSETPEIMGCPICNWKSKVNLA